MSETLKIVYAMDVSSVVAGTQKATAELGKVETAAKKAGTATAAGGKQAADGLDKTAAAAGKAGTAAADAGARQEAAAKQAAAASMDQAAAVEKVGTALIAAGAVSVAVAAGSVALATQWESDYAGVRKTVDGTVAQMAELEGQLRGITKVASASHTEVAAVGEAAGQLGVKRQDVAKFTKTMIDLGVATNLTAEEGAVQLRQFMNIMGSAADDVTRIGSAVVGLGNNSATTERDIVAMSQRLAGAGKQARMSESEVLAMAAAMASVGIEAEAGGTAMSLTLKQIDAMARSGGPKLQILGDIAGMSGDQFATAWGSNAATAMDAVVLGLGRMSAEGADVNGVLDDLGFKGIRQSDTLLRLSGATKAMGGEVDLLSESLRISAEEFERNTALQIEAETRYGTTAEKAKIATNQIKDGLIDMGNALLPVANDGIQVVSDLATAFAALPDTVKGGIGVVSALGGAMLIGAGGALKAATAFKAAKEAVTALGVSMRGASLAGGAIGLLLVGAAALIGHLASESATAQQRQDRLAEAIRGANGELRDQQGLLNESVAAAAAKEAQDSGLLDIASKYGIELNLVTEAMVGNLDAQKQVADAMQAQADAANRFGSGLNAKETQADLEAMRDGVQWYSGAIADQVAAEKQVAEAKGESTDATRKGIEATAEAARKQGELAEATRVAEEALRKHIEALYAESDAKNASLSSTLDVNSAMLDAADRAKEWKKEAKEAGESTKDAFSDTTRAGIENNKVMLRASQAAKDDIKTKIESGASTEKLIKLQNKHRDELVQTAIDFGLTKKEAEKYVNQLFAAPSDIETIALLQAAVAQAKLAEWEDQLDGLPDEKVAEIKAALDKGQITEAERLLDRAARTRTATITVNTVGNAGDLKRYGQVASAAGNILTYYAAGGVRVGDHANAHKPTILPAGTNRVFAEEETGGEAYIPLRDDWRRPRAESILATVADHFGLRLVKDVAAFAAGGVVGSLTGAQSAALAGLQIGAFPIAQLNAFSGALTKATTAADKAAVKADETAQALATATKGVKAAEKDLKAAKTGTKAYQAAEKEYKAATRAVDPRSDLGRETKKLRDMKRKKAPKGASKEQRAARQKEIDKQQAKVDRLNDKRDLRIAEARDRLEWERVQHDKNVTAAEKKLSKAKTDEAKAAEKNAKAQAKAKAAADAQADAARALEEATKRLADAARQISEQYVARYLGQGGDLADILASAEEGTQLGDEFAGLIDQLRGLGLDEDFIQQVVISQGEVWGADLARQIIAGGKPTVDQLNRVADNLEKVADRLGMTQAIGVKQYADGGIHEVHEAMIGTGVTRVWDEPETGGEAYIPLAESKRRRSLAIWAETGRLLGAQPVREFANGAVITTASASYARTPTVTNNYSTHTYQLQLPSWIRHAGQMADFFENADVHIHQAGGR